MVSSKYCCSVCSGTVVIVFLQLANNTKAASAQSNKKSVSVNHYGISSNLRIILLRGIVSHVSNHKHQISKVYCRKIFSHTPVVKIISDSFTKIF
jgi:hypothetical protein